MGGSLRCLLKRGQLKGSGWDGRGYHDLILAGLGVSQSCAQNNGSYGLLAIIMMKSYV